MTESHGTGWTQTEALVDVMQALELYDPRDDAAPGESDHEGPDYQDAQERLSGEDFDTGTLRSFAIALNELHKLVHEELERKTGRDLDADQTFGQAVRDGLRTR